ncbi:hypothetical protein LX32DRAFT_658951 [Colletotrichum zoysiae]|uniref:Uncharacterized protein n=1 Tax=Colletotrichum zoysiae TaxID=1216348 RepID=A0AAD9LUB0_9PEZI|nr:hypothetical protein LX32DRAFT_658951 [Colletotrichum zoysiae]
MIKKHALGKIVVVVVVAVVVVAGRRTTTVNLGEAADGSQVKKRWHAGGRHPIPNRKRNQVLFGKPDAGATIRSGVLDGALERKRTFLLRHESAREDDLRPSDR